MPVVSKLYLETGHGNVHFYQHFSAPVLFFTLGRFRSSLIASFKKNKMAGCEADENRKIDEGISLELCAVYGQRRQAS